MVQSTCGHVFRVALHDAAKQLGVRRLVLQTVRGADGAARLVGEAFIAAAAEIERIELR